MLSKQTAPFYGRLQARALIFLSLLDKSLQEHFLSPPAQNFSRPNIRNIFYLLFFFQYGHFHLSSSTPQRATALLRLQYFVEQTLSQQHSSATPFAGQNSQFHFCQEQHSPEQFFRAANKAFETNVWEQLKLNQATQLFPRSLLRSFQIYPDIFLNSIQVSHFPDLCSSRTRKNPSLQLFPKFRRTRLADIS